MILTDFGSTQCDDPGGGGAHYISWGTELFGGEFCLFVNCCLLGGGREFPLLPPPPPPPPQVKNPAHLQDKIAFKLFWLQVNV